MQIDFIEVSNYRKLLAARIDIAKTQTLFVGANNSGKTSAMVALRQFLKDRGGFTTKDMTQPRDPGRSFGESVRLSFCC